MRARAAALSLVLLALAAGEAAPGNDSARTWLAEVFDVAPADLARIDRGEVFSRTLEASHPREVGTLGIVRIRITPEFYATRAADITTFKRDDKVLQIGTFSTPPRVDDATALTLPDDDRRKLPGGNAPRFLADYVTRYLEKGPDGHQESEALMESDPAAWRHVPRLRHHLTSYPVAGADGMLDVVYWSKERVHKKPVLSVTHLAIAQSTGESPVAYAIASKQIYAMHYFDASLGLTLLVPDRRVPSPVTYVVYLNRSRIDLFGGLFGGIARKIVAGKARTLVAEQLARLQRELEPQFENASR